MVGMRMVGAQSLLSMITLLAACAVTETCMGLGGCGFGGCCIYGHFCARARGVKSLTRVDGTKLGESSVSLRDERAKVENYANFEKFRRDYVADENEEFLECCKQRGLPDSCFNKCSYQKYEQNALRRMFFRVDQCPLLAANDIHYCAAQGRDHRQCCMMNGVTTTIAKNKCLIFCDQRPQNETLLDVSYLPCFERFESIKGCFWRWARKQHQLGLLPKRESPSPEQQPPSPFGEVNRDEYG